MDPLILNWLKDVGIATATLLVLGNVMARLLQSTIEFYRGVREDNKERNKQFATLLGINEAIAGQMDLTRQAIEHSARSSVEQDHAIRSNTEGMDTLRLDIVTRLDVLGKQI